MKEILKKMIEEVEEEEAQNRTLVGASWPH